MKRITRLCIAGVALAVISSTSVGAELSTIPLGYNFDEPEWNALPFEAQKAILLDEPYAAVEALDIPKRRRDQLGNYLFRTEVMQFYAEYGFYFGWSCHPELAQEFADLSTVIPSFWDRINAYLKTRFPEVDPAMIDRVMRAGRAKAVSGRPRWPRDSEVCTNYWDRDEKELREQLEKVRTMLTEPVEKLDALIEGPAGPVAPH
jgi:hypothetical protein